MRLLRTATASHLRLSRPRPHQPALVRYQHKRKPPEVKPCVKPCTKPSLWKRLYPGTTKKERHWEDPVECELTDYIEEEDAEKTMKEATKEGAAVRTCGSGILIQPEPAGKLVDDTPHTPIDSILDDMTRHPTLKGVCDPMPPFNGSALRMIQLSERKLHPMYKLMMTVPKKAKQAEPQPAKGSFYRPSCEPRIFDENPLVLRIDRGMFDRKNAVYEYKRFPPPNGFTPKYQKQIEEAKGPHKDCVDAK